jgi:CRISPR-associated protein Cmr5
VSHQAVIHQTASQKMAHSAFDQVEKRKPDKEYRSFARDFPTLVHSCGLAQTLAFALAKEGHQLEYADDLATVLTSAGFPGVETAKKLAEKTHSVSVAEYLRLSRAGLAAAIWLKRYVEAGVKNPS